MNGARMQNDRFCQYDGKKQQSGSCQKQFLPFSNDSDDVEVSKMQQTNTNKITLMDFIIWGGFLIDEEVLM